MTIRQAERDWGSDTDNDAWLDDNEDLWRSRLHAEGLHESMRLNMQFARAQALQDAQIFHPAITDFCLSSVADFLRCEIDKAVADGRLGKGKGKEPARSESRGQDDGRRQQKQPASIATNDQDLKSDLDNSNEQPAAPASLTLAKDALLHLRGLKSKEAVSQASQPAAIEISLLTARSHNNTIPVRSMDAFDSHRSQAHMRAGGIRRPNLPNTDRSSDFAQHTQQVRYRARSEQRQLASPLRRAVNAATSDNLASVRVATSIPGHISRGQHIPASSSQPLNSIDGSAGMDPAVDAGSEDLPCALSLFSPSVEVASQDQGVPDAYSDLIPSDDVETVEDLDSLSGVIATDTDSERVEGGGENDMDPFQGGFQPRHVACERSKTKRPARDTTSNAFDLPTANSLSPSKPPRVKNYNYPQIVAAEKPKIVQQHQTIGDKNATSSTPPDPRRAVTSSRDRDCPSHRHMADSTNSDALSEENTQLACTGKTSSKQLVKYVVMNDVKDRSWDPHYPPCSDLAPPNCSADSDAPTRNVPSSNAPILPFNYEVWNQVAGYLSFEDLRNLRLTCKGFATEIAPIMLRSVVTTFGKSMFGSDLTPWNSKNTSLANSMLAKYGHGIHKFGISFEYDPIGLMYAEPKVTEKKEDAWYGSYLWPLETYSRFPELQELEDLVDNNRPLLKDSLGMLKRASELALSLGIWSWLVEWTGYL